MHFELTRDEWTEVTELVRTELNEINPEIHHTETPEYLDELHRRRDLLSALLKRLELATHFTA